jgi:hypothetical protein
MTTKTTTLVPPELRELLTLLSDLAQPLPCPVQGSGGWDARHDREIWHTCMLRTRIDGLVDQLRVGDQYPSVAAECLASYCQRSAAAIRAELAKPLGYDADEPKGEPGEAA